MAIFGIDSLEFWCVLLSTPGLGPADLLHLQTQWSLGDASPILASQRAVQDVWKTQDVWGLEQSGVFLWWLLFVLHVIYGF